METRSSSDPNASLEIYRSSRKCGKITGNDEIILFCSQISDKNDIEVEFVQYESKPLTSSLISSSIAATTATITSSSLASSQSHIFPSLDQTSGRIIKWKELAFVDRDNIHANSVLIIRTPPYTCITPVEPRLHGSQLNSQPHHHRHHQENSRFFTRYNNKIRSKVEKVFYRLYRPSTGQRSEDWAFYYWLSESTSTATPSTYAATALNQLHFLDTCCMFGAIYNDNGRQQQHSSGSYGSSAAAASQPVSQLASPQGKDEQHGHSRSNSFRIVTGTITKLFNKNNEKPLLSSEGSTSDGVESGREGSVPAQLRHESSFSSAQHQPQPHSSAGEMSSQVGRHSAESTIVVSNEDQQADYYYYRQSSPGAVSPTSNPPSLPQEHDSPNQSKKNLKKSRSNSILLDKILLIDSTERTSGRLKKSRTTTSFPHSTSDRVSNHNKKSTSYKYNLNERILNENSEVVSNTSSYTVINKSPTKLRFDQSKSFSNGGSVQEDSEDDGDGLEPAKPAQQTATATKRPSKAILKSTSRHKKCVIL